MSALGSGAHVVRDLRSGLSGPALLVLVRIGAEGGATRAEAVADIAPLFTHKLSPADWRRAAEKGIAALISAGLVTETRGRLSATPVGASAAARYLGEKSCEAKAWTEVRDVALIAKGLGLEKEPPGRLKALARIEGLRELIVQKSFGLPVKKNQPPARLRAQLAVVALERAFGNRIKAGFGKSSALSSKAGRLLAGQLSQTPRDFSTDAKLVAGLAAECAGSVETSIEALRQAILRGLGTRALEGGGESGHTPEPPRATVPVQINEPGPSVAPAANDGGPTALVAPKLARPDLGEFSRAVKDAASARAEGWPGSRKAYISHVWDAIRVARPRWELSEIEFKCMLAEAHRLGVIALANADLKDKKSMKELESSAVPYKNTVWHFVRVEE